MLARLALSLVALAAMVRAHFILNSPPSRGFDDDNEANFCDSFATNATGRHVFPLTGTAPISILSAHDQWQFGVVISNRANPTSFADFNGTNGYNYILPFLTDSGEGNFCFNVDMSAASSALNLTNGSLATIQAIFNGGDGVLYQCADLILVEGAPINGSCTNSTTSSSVALPSSSPTGTSASLTPSSTASSSGSASAPSASASNSGTSGYAVASFGGFFFALAAGLVAIA